MGTAHADQPAGLTLNRMDVMKRGKFDGPGSCMECHTQPTQNRIELGALDFVLLTEYAAWKTQDKHAQAFAVLVGPRGQQMARALGMKVHEDAAAGCLNCHAMNYLGQKGRAFFLDEGVSCGGCHGPSEHWFREHQTSDWRKQTPAQKEEAGMLDLRHPVRRAELCLSCHVGNAAEGKVITHAMYAAGHPPLPPLEVATFARNLPQHWRDARDVPYFQNPSPETRKNYHLESIAFQRTRFALVGSVVALRETMQLIADRADSKPVDVDLAKKLWPELLLGIGPDDKAALTSAAARERWPELAMSHSDCYACHHELRYPAWRQVRGFGFPLPNGGAIKGIPGRPQVKPWPIALLELAIVHAARAPGRLSAAERTKELDALLRQLVAATNARPFGDPDKMRAAALALVTWSQKLQADLMAAPYDEASAGELVRSLISLPSLRYADFETARQATSILQVVCDDFRLREDKPADQKIRQLLADMQKKWNVRPYGQRAERQALINKVLAKMTTEKDSLPAMAQFYAALQNLGNLEMQKELRRNRFLTTLRDDIGDPKLTKEFQAKDVIVPLQEISDKELTTSLEKTNNYDPDEFFRQLQDLAKLWKERK